jgi:DNA-binding MarR family transcriptional regulator
MLSSRPRTGGGDAVRLGELLGRSWRTFSRLGQARFAESGLSAASVRLLLALAAEPDSRMGDLAKRLGVTARALTPITDSLANDGLVTRVVDPTDRRAFKLVLTELGTTRAENLGNPAGEDQRRDLRRLDLRAAARPGATAPHLRRGSGRRDNRRVLTATTAHGPRAGSLRSVPVVGRLLSASRAARSLSRRTTYACCRPTRRQR